MSADDWARVNRVYELVRHEGDADCERAIADLIAEVDYWCTRAKRPREGDVDDLTH